ncbi:MAG: DUF3298 domain-containing protein [Tannerella sp.]|nr:DUF3298 domain-containing protein [Tannerella sp.]
MMDKDIYPDCSLKINFIYPADYPDKGVLKSIQKQFISEYFDDEYADLTPKEAVEKYTKDYMDTFKENEKAFLADIEDHQSEPEALLYSEYLMINHQVMYNRNDLLSFEIYREVYNGGAHGGHNYSYKVLNLKTGRQITESDIFIDDYQDDLTKIIIDGIALFNNVDEVEELENIGYFDINEIRPNKNFYVDETGITYTFNEYEIAAYVVGATFVQLPYEKIRHLLRKDSPIATIAF